MTARAHVFSCLVGLAAGLLSPLACASFLWQSDGQVPMRIDIATATTQSAGEPGPVDAIVPLPDGGAWLRRGSELIRLAPDLRVAARASVALAGTMHWEPQSRRLWVLAGRDLLRYDEHLLLEGAVRFDVELRGLSGSGPDAVWVATGARLIRVQRDGETVDAVELSSVVPGGSVAGILADTPRARVWVVATSGDVVAFDAADGLRATGLRHGLAQDAQGVTVDAASGAIRQFVGGTWRPIVGEGAAATAEAPVGEVLPSIGVLRFGGGIASSEAMPAVAVPIVVVGAHTHLRSLWLPPEAVTVIAGPPVVRSTAAGIRVIMDLEARCGAVVCAGADPLMGTLRADVQLGDQARSGVVQRRDDRWAVEAEFDGVVEAGTHPLVVSLANAFGNRSRFDDHEVTVDAGSPAQAKRVRPKALPVVSITSPAHNAAFVAPASITIDASASVSGATLARVEFLRDGTLLATDTTAPYRYTWTNVAAGTYALAARAYDNAGGTTTSAIVTITVKPNVPPSVTLTGPSGSTIFTAPATVDLAASASDTDGSIAKVEFFRGTTRIATDTTAPYAYSWSNVAGGTYTLTARATDDKGAVTTSPAVIAIVNRPPSTSITAPANNAVLAAPLNLTVKASASDADGTVSKVEFLRNGTLVATDTTSPYAYTWNSVPLGTHTLASRATDNRGAITTSAPVTVTVNANVAPSVAITSPAPGARFVHPASVPITATATDSDGTIARVEFHYDYGLLGSDTSSPHSYTWKSPYHGTFALTARAVDDKGAVTASAPVSITIVPNQPPTVTLTGDPPEGAVLAAEPPTFQLTATASDVDGTVARVRFLRYDPLVEAYVEIATDTQPPFTVEYVAPSLESEYRFRAEATDNGGATGEADIHYMISGNRAPQTVLLEPGVEAEWSGFEAPATIVVVVEAKDFDRSPDRIARVDLLANGSPVASLTAPAGARGEYVHVWRDVPAGTHNLVVRAVDTFGAIGEWSRSVKVVDTSRLAAVTIAQPVSGQLHGDPVPLQANVVAGSAAISHVDYVNALGRKVATSAIAPYAASWVAPPSGRHAITAVAVQSDGVAVTSPTVFFDVAATGSKTAPLVVLTSPTALGSLNADAPIIVAAEALADRAASIAKVEFFNKGVLIGTATAAPYQIAWVGAPAGTATLTAKATDSTAPATNSMATSTPITLTLTSANPPPSVSLTAPGSGATYAAPATISLAATASDTNGSVAKVEFFNGGALIGTDTTSPYAFTWSNVPAGTYALTAKATDSGGATSTSTVRTVTVVNNAPPQVALTAPVAGQSYAFGAPIPLAATASDAEGTIARVDFFSGATLIFTGYTAPYAFAWSGGAVGTHSITARATDNLGATTTSSAVGVTVTANALPGVSLVLPRAGQRFVSGQTINLVATADDADGTVARVEFLRSGTLVGTATSAPYVFAWANLPTGTFDITARVVDNLGATQSSNVATIFVSPLYAVVESPPDYAQVASPSVMVSGWIGAPPNSGVTVNGVRAQVHGYQFFANDVPLAEGANAISVVVVTADGVAATTTRNVTRIASAPIRVFVDAERGFAPHTATVRVDNPTGVTIAGVRYESLGGAVLDATGANQEVLGKLTLASAGIATPTVVVTDAAGNVYRQQVGVLAVSRSSVDALLKATWNAYAATLAAGRVDLALASLPAVTAARYKPILDPLGPHFATIIPTWSAPMTGRIADDVGEYTIARAIDGQNRLFFIYFVRDDRGIWRLDSM